MVQAVPMVALVMRMTTALPVVLVNADATTNQNGKA